MTSTSLLLAGVSLALIIASVVIPAIYNIYFHPLSHVPGPKLWLAFPLLRHWEGIRGTFDKEARKLHNKYGDVVRTAPDELSFTTTQAWKDAYGHSARGQLPKVMIFDEEARNVFNAEDPLVHGRMRKVLAPCFSERGVRRLEPTIAKYTNMLLDRFREFARTGELCDVCKWYNLTTFDIIGDLAFGESFDGLDTGRTSPWVETIFNTLRILPILTAASEYPFVMQMIGALMPASVAKARAEHVQLSRDKASRRIHNEALAGSGDFMDTMMAAKGSKDEFSYAELTANANILIIAGSETSATSLSGITYWLCRTPAALSKLTHEIRSSFQSEEEITMVTASNNLPYLQACIDEGLRIYPPGVGAIWRYVPTGETRVIDGITVPAKTKVAVHHSAAYWSERHFKDALTYVPERWLPEAASNPASAYYNDDRAIVQPFSVGPRNCLGQSFAWNEIRYIFARLLWNFDIALDPQSIGWEDQKAYVIWEKRPLKVKLTSRFGGQSL